MKPLQFFYTSTTESKSSFHRLIVHSIQPYIYQHRLIQPTKNKTAKYFAPNVLK